MDEAKTEPVIKVAVDVDGKHNEHEFASVIVCGMTSDGRIITDGGGTQIVINFLLDYAKTVSTVLPVVQMITQQKIRDAQSKIVTPADLRKNVNL